VTGTALAGTWSASDAGDGGAQLRLELRWGTSSWGRPLARAELRGLADGDLAPAASAPVAFRIEREAGVLEMEGTFHGSSGSGRFRFRPNRGFADTLASIGVEGTGRITDADLMVLAVNGATAAAMHELATLGLGPLDADDVTQLAIFEVTPGYVRALRAAGLSGTGTVAGLVELRIHRVTAEYVRELAAAGYGRLSHAQLLELGIHGVGADDIRELRSTGYAELSPRQLVDLRIHRITPAFIRELREAGVRDLSPEALVRLRVSNVSLDYVRALEALGYRGLTQPQLLQMGILGVTPAFIRKVRDAGFTDPSPGELIQWKIHGPTRGSARPNPRS